MTTATRMTRLSTCCQYAGFPAVVLDTTSGSNLNAKRPRQRRAEQAGDGSHTHITIGDCLLIHPLPHASQEVAQ